jgi:glycosyltransferase involved in cell wall biosynthesis
MHSQKNSSMTRETSKWSPVDYKEQTIKVSVIIVTYNQEKYIAQAIEGALMQKTDFPFEIIIHDDASTDSTADIIRSYQSKHIDIIHAILQTENQYTKIHWGLLAAPYKRARGKYIALCDGDDFWTDSSKLQKQVDFMEAHPNCSISCHKVLYHFENEGVEDYEFPDITGDRIFSKDKLFGNYISATSSIMFVNEKIDELQNFLNDFMVYDLPIIYFYLNIGDMAYLDKRMTNYRLHNQSFYHPLKSIKQEFIQFDTFIKLKSRLQIKGSKKMDRKIINHGFCILEEYQKEMNYRGMRKILRQSFRAHPKINYNQFTYYIKYSLIAFFPWIDKLVFRKRHESPSQ